MKLAHLEDESLNYRSKIWQKISLLVIMTTQSSQTMRTVIQIRGTYKEHLAPPLRRQMILRTHRPLLIQGLLM